MRLLETSFYLEKIKSQSKLLDILGGDNEDEAYQSRLDIGGNILNSMVKVSINRENKIISFKIRNWNEEDKGNNRILHCKQGSYNHRLEGGKVID